MIRPYNAGDMPRIREMYQQHSFAYELPDFNKPSFPIRLVLDDENGKTVMAAFAHLTAELYLLADGNAGTPEQRWKRFQELHQAGLEMAYYPGGLDDLHCWIPPQIEKSFGRRLKRLGWAKALWPSYSIDVSKEK